MNERERKRVEEELQRMHEEIHSDDFQFVLRALLAGYQPLLEQDLRRAQDPEGLKKEAESNPPSCEDEFNLANQLFDKFMSEEVVLRLLPPQARELLGPPERWRWCLRHIRCCIIYGWLVCRGPRTFRGFAYYLYRFWLCVREALDTPIKPPLTDEQRRDFQTLVQALGGAFKPYLTDQLASIDSFAQVSEEVLAGQIDCTEGDDDAAAIFERLLTTETAPALLGREAFEAHRQDPFFWFCRCWCLCAIRFGCCLARAHNLVDVLRCLLDYFRCLAECFRPLECTLTGPHGCVAEQLIKEASGPAVVVTGTAAGGSFDHYTIEWRKVEGQACDDDSGWSTIGVFYPGGASTGSAPVVTGTLGWINTLALSASSYEVRVCVYPSAGTRLCCCTQFDLFKQLVWIDRVAIAPGAPVQTPPGPLACDPPIVNTNPGGIVVPVGGCVTVKGSAFVGDCNNRHIKCFDLRYAVGWQPCPTDVGFAGSLPLYTGSLLVPTGPVCYTDPDPMQEAQKRAQLNWVIERALTTRFVQTTVTINGFTFTVWKLQDFCFDSANLLPLGVTDAGCPDPHHRCRSGKYTLLVQVEDTLGTKYYDTQQVWFDNKPITVEFDGLEGLPGCTDLHLSGGTKFVPPGAPCNVPWRVNLLGIAYDEYIDETDTSYPSDNFDSYSLYITRQGGPTLVVPITPDLVTFGPDPLEGNQRVGEPGVRCEPVPAVGGCPPPSAVPPKSSGLLTKLDLRIFDAVCAPSIPASENYAVPAGFPLERGTCCGYTFQLYAQDKTWSDGFAGGLHRAWSLPWAVCICNDLPSTKG